MVNNGSSWDELRIQVISLGFAQAEHVWQWQVNSNEAYTYRNLRERKDGPYGQRT